MKMEHERTGPTGFHREGVPAAKAVILRQPKNTSARRPAHSLIGMQYEIMVILKVFFCGVLPNHTFSAKAPVSLKL